MQPRQRVRMRAWSAATLSLFGAATVVLATQVFPVGAAAPAAEAPARQPDVIYVPTPQPVVEAMLKVAEVKKDEMVYDLGCGDGRIVITAAQKFGAQGIGVDIDPQRIKESKENAQKANVTDRVKFVQQDLFTMDFKDADVVALYLLPSLNVKLRPKLFSELRPGTRIVSHAFDMGEWQPDQKLQPEGREVFFWVIPVSVGGTWRSPGAAGGEDSVLTLEQKFQNVSGTLKMGDRTLPITDAKLTGDQIRFTVADTAGSKTTMRMNGRVTGDSIQGTLETKGGASPGKRDWTAKREGKAQPIEPASSGQSEVTD